MNLAPLPKLLIFSGLTLVAVGLGIHFFGKYLPLGKLPGDINLSGKGWNVHFPLVTCLLISLILSALGMLFRFFK